MAHRNREPTQGEARSQVFLTRADRGLCGNDVPRALAQYLAELRLLLIQTTISPRHIKGPAYTHCSSIGLKKRHAGQRTEGLRGPVGLLQRSTVRVDKSSHPGCSSEYNMSAEDF